MSMTVRNQTAMDLAVAKGHKRVVELLGRAEEIIAYVYMCLCVHTSGKCELSFYPAPLATRLSM